MQLRQALGAALLATAALLAPVVQAAPAADCNDGNVVRMAGQDWESAGFTTQVIRALLGAAFGCRVEIVPGTTAALETALAQDDIQVMAEVWSGRSAILQQAIDSGAVQVVGDTLAGGAVQGWYVPDYVVHGDPQRGMAAVAPGLRSWRDLPRYKTLFPNPENPAMGRFLNCPRGWVCEKTNSRLLRLHGLEQDYDNVRAGTGAALDAAISSAYERGVPILFYYWRPAGLMAKYKFAHIAQDPFDPACWQTIVSGEEPMCSSDFLTARLAVAVSAPFARANPELVALFQRLQFDADLLDRVILEMAETRRSGSAMAGQFLREHAAVWHAWLDPVQAGRAERALRIQWALAGDGADAGEVGPAGAAGMKFFPDWSTAGFVNERLAGVVESYGTRLRLASNFLLRSVLLPLERGLMAVPAWLVLLLVAAISWHATRKWLATVLYVLGLYAIGAVGLWGALVQTFALVLAATLVTIVLGIPLGIVAAQDRWLRRVITPCMDAMQTLPSFVYLVPVLMLFGLGKVPALFATIVYALPPLVRLTALGLRQVDHGVTEAAQSFGVTRWQMLTRVTLPLARPSIMAGINQATMMALAMVVVASMIGARGLGEDVLAGIQTLDVGRGLQAGVAIVILAIVIDRITQAYGRTRRQRARALEGSGS